MNPGDTRLLVLKLLRELCTLNEGRDVNPGRHTTSAPGHHARHRPLNEGRDVNPGDTRLMDAKAPVSERAQRRPGRESRRHIGALRAPEQSPPAQRRPGRGIPATRPVRTLHAGFVESLNEGRDVNPGDTRGPLRRHPLAPAALNEGRDVNPGDTTP